MSGSKTPAAEQWGPALPREAFDLNVEPKTELFEAQIAAYLADHPARTTPPS